MKTIEIKDVLKKDLLVVEIPRKGEVEIFPNSIEIYNQFTGQEDTIEGSYALLGRPDEIKEEDAKELVEEIEYRGSCYYRSYLDGFNFYDTATESLLSAIETKVFWENPWGVNGGHLDSYKDLWRKAEQKTFDKTRTLIFIKN